VDNANVILYQIMEYNNFRYAIILLIFVISGCFSTNEMVANSPATLGSTFTQQDEKQNSDIKIKEVGEFIDSDGILNVVGVVDNNGIVPVNVVVGLNITKDTSKNKQLDLASNSALSSPISLSSKTSEDSTSVSTLTESLYGKVIYPKTGAPFKFKVEAGNHVLAQPFVEEVRELPSPSYTDILVLNYSNIAVGEEKTLVGTIKNTGPFEVNNVYIYASIHNSNRTQIDSAKSPVIPVIQPGEEVQFKVEPDPAIKSQAFYYSCAGLDYDSPITTLATGDGGFIPYTLEGLAKITEIRYENASNSIVFGVDHYNPDGGLITLKLPQMNHNEKPSVLMDELPYSGDDAKITSDGKTIYIDIFVPPEEHQVQVKGISSMT
jgi:hypothetical protein